MLGFGWGAFKIVASSLGSIFNKLYYFFPLIIHFKNPKI
jgi:hypothetical protein